MNGGTNDVRTERLPVLTSSFPQKRPGVNCQGPGCGFAKPKYCTCIGPEPKSNNFASATTNKQRCIN